MLRRHLCLVRAWSAAGLITSSLLGASAASGADRGLEQSAGSLVAQNDAVSLLDAKKAGDLAIEARGAGQYQVKMTLKNASAKRLNVIIPPGLVASSTAGQGGRGGGFQSMGLGSSRNRPGGFGEFKGAGMGESSGFRSIGVNPEVSNAIAIPAGASVDVPMSSVCLNYGIPTPTHKDSFEIMMVEDYTKDTRVHKALRSLVALGTSQGVAQAAMWRVCNDVPYDVMAKESKKVLNDYEIALAERFVDALDASGSSELVDPAYLAEGRVFVRVLGDKAMAADATRLSDVIDGQKVLGLPVQAYRADNHPKVSAPALLFDVMLVPNRDRGLQAKVVMNLMSRDGNWQPIGKFDMLDKAPIAVLDGRQLTDQLNRAIAKTYVTIKPVSRGKGVNSFKVENRLPFTVGSIMVKTGESLGSAAVPFNGLGIAPVRSTTFTLQAPTAIVDRVELNGL